MNIAKYYDNKYFKYVLMFLSATNLITFVIKKKYDTIIFFIAISILIAHYTKSTSIILLISLITSNLFNSFEHQKEGLNWLIDQHISRRGSILADEMGLGKTI